MSEIQECDVLIIGGGIAGLTAALNASKYGKVILLNKGKIGESATEKAQGGIAAAINQPKDSPKFHFEDTIAAGAGLCDEKAVTVLVEDGVDRVKELIEMGAQFDKGESGFELAIEGAHRQRRILHAGDATGEEIERTLGRRVVKEGLVDIKIYTFGSRLIIEDGICRGAVAIDIIKNRIKTFISKATIITTGGLGQIYLNTTNPIFATGDGISMAYRAGAQVSDMEFFQFHPTALVQFKDLEDIVALPQFLISEAVRGEGGILLNSDGVRFMNKYHHRGELAPRDIVARAIVAEMKKNKSNHVFLSLKNLEPQKIKQRFPTIYMTCIEKGLDITEDNIPVAPAAHYFMGGIRTDLNARTNIPGLYAAGESAATGVHGANRLASNSLLEGLVFGKRAAEDVKKYLKKNPNDKTQISNESQNQKIKSKEHPAEEYKKSKEKIKRTMWNNVGIIREEKSLKKAILDLTKLEKDIDSISSYQEIELQNMILLSKLVANAALERKESRGAHYRLDYPKTDDKNWKRHLIYKLG